MRRFTLVADLFLPDRAECTPEDLRAAAAQLLARVGCRDSSGFLRAEVSGLHVREAGATSNRPSPQSSPRAPQRKAPR